MDPIGQLASWLYDRLKELASWFAATVDTVFRSIYASVISPVLTGIRSVVDSVASSVASALSKIADVYSALSSLWTPWLSPSRECCLRCQT